MKIKDIIINDIVKEINIPISVTKYYGDSSLEYYSLNFQKIKVVDEEKLAILLEKIIGEKSLEKLLDK